LLALTKEGGARRKEVPRTNIAKLKDKILVGPAEQNAARGIPRTDRNEQYEISLF
jgi:hypothetical protein